MKSLYILCLLVCLAWAYNPESRHQEDHELFAQAQVGSSQDLYDLFEDIQDKIFVAAFTLGGDEHEDAISELENILSKEHDIFDSIVYLEVDASDHYQYKGILYDLDILTELHTNYPYFLVMKEQTGNVVRGENAAQQMETVIRRISSE